MGALIFILIFVFIIVALLVIAFIGSRKDKRERIKNLAELKIIDEQAKAARIYLLLSLNYLLNFLELRTKDFDHNNSPLTIGQINNKIKTELVTIKDSEMLKQIYASKDFRLEFKPIIDQLLNSKPTNWTKEASFALSLIKNKAKFLLDDDENQQLIKEIEEKYYAKQIK